MMNVDENHECGDLVGKHYGILNIGGRESIVEGIQREVIEEYGMLGRGMEPNCSQKKLAHGS